MSWVERLRVALEVTSRLVLRLDPRRSEAVFDMALNHYQDDRLDHFLLADPLWRLLERSWETLLPDQQARRIPDLLSAPIAGLDGFMERSESGSADPSYLLMRTDLSAPARTADTEEQWKQIVHLAVRGLRAGNEARKRASCRVMHAALWGLLTESESVEVAQALWAPRYVDDSHLPVGTTVIDVVFLALPEPETGLAERRFRKKWLDVDNPPQGGEDKLADVLWQVGNAISWLRHRRRPLRLAEEEASYLIEIAERWAELPIPLHSVPYFEHELEATRRSISGLCDILSEVPFPLSVADKLYRKISELNESETPGFTLMAGILKALPDRLDEIVLSMRMGLVSEKEILAEDAAWGLFHWMKASNASEGSFPEPPIDLVREIGVIIAARRSVSLDVALQIARWIFEEGSEEQEFAVSDMVIQGLGYLFEELRYDRRHERDEDSIPSLRRDCVHLALSMAEQGFEEAPVVSRWLTDAESDPMPEVRYAKARRQIAVCTGNQDMDASSDGDGTESTT